MFSSFYSLFRPPPTSTLFPYTTLFRSIRTDHLTELVQLLERSVPAVRRHVEDQTVDACGRQPLDLIRARLRVVGHRDSVAARGFGQLLELGNPLDHTSAVGHPSVRVTHHPLEDLRPATAEDDRRVRLLDRLRKLPHGSEVDHVAVVLGHVLGPDGLDRLDPLAQELPAGAEVSAEIGRAHV